MKNKMVLILLIMLLSMAVSYAGASTLYVTGQHNIARYDSDGTNGTTVWSNGYAGISGIADDPINDDVYYRTEQYPYRDLWRDSDPGNIDTSGGDLTKIQSVSLVSNNTFFGNTDYDALGNDIFYINDYISYGQYYTSIIKIDLDTNAATTLYNVNRRQIIGYQGYYNPQPVYAWVHDVEDIVVDPIDNNIYWTDKHDNSINKLDINNTAAGVQSLYTGLVNPYGIALDRGTGTVFWSEMGSSGNNYDSFIRSGSVNGDSPALTLLSDTDGNSATYYRDIDVDPDLQKIYFVNYVPEYSGVGKVMTMNYGGQNIQNFTTSSGSQILGNLIELSSGANYVTANTVPEPASFSLLIAGGALIGLGRFAGKRK